MAFSSNFSSANGKNDGYVWFMIHSGSRNFGYKIAEEYHRLALKECLKRNVELPDKDLAYLPIDKGPGLDYKTAMDYALLFAAANRQLMKETVAGIFQDETRCSFVHEINIHHNFAAE
jgi:tRNA-splicing ligase RtcB (3'-phosphate/5'-hydroxy nucleic acid ligase)